MMRIKKNDMVMVISGKDKGKSGDVIAILPKKDKIKIQGIAIAVKHKKATRQGEVPGIKREETFINACKVMLVCSSCKKPCRTGASFLSDGKKARVCGRCKEAI